MDPGLDPFPDPTPFFSDHRHITYLQSSLNFLLKFCVNFNLSALFQSAQHIYENWEGSGAGAVLWGSGSGRPKNMRIRTPNTDLRFSSVFFVALLRLNIPDNSQITIILCREKRFLYGHGTDLNTDILPSANA